MPTMHVRSSGADLPEMIPLRLRNQSEFSSPRAQQQYAPFRTTEFSPRGVGGAFELKTDRDVNPTTETTVQRFYDTHTSHDVASQMTKRGNTVSTLQSTTPRFHSIDETSGPGTYSPERFHGAFPLLLERSSPATALHDRQLERASVDTALALTGTNPHKRLSQCSIAPPNTSSPCTLAKPRPSALYTRTSHHHHHQLITGYPTTSSLEAPLQSARLVAQLTPRIAYSAANRQQLLRAGASVDPSD